jgi:hypothetical protein
MSSHKYGKKVKTHPTFIKKWHFNSKIECKQERNQYSNKNEKLLIDLESNGNTLKTYRLGKQIISHFSWTKRCYKLCIQSNKKSQKSDDKFNTTVR